MKKIIFYVIAFSFICQMGFSQVIINEDFEVSRVLSIYEQKAFENSEIDGWRIQINNTDDRRTMESIRSKFSSSYPTIKMSWEHVQPYYQVKIGAYKTKLELEPFLRELKEDFPRAIPVRAKIEKSELLR